MSIASPETMISRAIVEAGLDDFGVDTWRPGFEKLVEESQKLPFTAWGKESVENVFNDALVGRLRIEQWMKDHPADAHAKIEGPVVILGLPRTASTALVNILSADPRWRYLRKWEAEQPMPPPVLGEEQNDPRFLKEKAFVAGDKTFLGKNIHDAGGPFEDGALVRLSFGGQEQAWPVFDYTRWWRDRSQEQTFAYHARSLRVLQTKRPPNRWVVKAPWYSLHLDDLRKVYPNAKIIATHRNPIPIIPSTASLLHTSFGRFIPAEKLDKAATGRFALEQWSIAITRMMDYLNRTKDPGFFHIHHEAFNADAHGEMQRLYDWLGVELTPQTREAMEVWAQEHRRGVHGEHRYAPEEYGVAEGEIRDAFADYIRTFSLRG
jgi:hypothetical protein